MKQPNVPMSHPITTCRHKVDKEKFDSGWDRIWGQMNKQAKELGVQPNARLKKYKDD